MFIIYLILIFAFTASISKADEVTESFETFNKTESEKEQSCRKEFDPTTNCYMACLYKAFKVIDSNGKFDPEGTKEWANRYSKFYTEMRKAYLIASQCLHVNDKHTTDGSKGCERALLLANCISDLVEKYPEYVTIKFPTM